MVRAPEPMPGGDRTMLSFETITLAPIARRPDRTAADDARRKIAWLDPYHPRVHGALSGWPTLTSEERGWLAGACRPLVG